MTIGTLINPKDFPVMVCIDKSQQPNLRISPKQHIPGIVKEDVGYLDQEGSYVSGLPSTLMFMPQG